MEKTLGLADGRQSGLPLSLSTPETITRIQEHEMLGLVYLARPLTYAQGLAESERARELMEKDPMTTSQLGYAYALAGQSAKAREMLRNLVRSPDGSVRALPVARVYAGLGDRDRTFSWLQKAVDQRDVALSLQADPVYDSLRSDPRFSGPAPAGKSEPSGFPLNFNAHDLHVNFTPISLPGY